MIESGVTTVLSSFAESFSNRLSELVLANKRVPATLAESMRYSLLAPGKRVRPFVVDRCCMLAGGDSQAAFPAAAALEMVHSFSLIHDDLPAMDDDDLRRGRPSNHKVFGEAQAILAGDALLALAFETLATRVPDPARAAALVEALAHGVGWMGMIAGQAADLLGEGEPPSLDRVVYIHQHKTAALFETACRMGGLAAGAGDELLERFSRYGRHMGLAFQIADDLLDLTSTTQEAGKSVQKDARREKQTYPACVGVERSRAAAADGCEAALSALEGFGGEADELRELARFAAARAR